MKTKQKARKKTTLRASKILRVPRSLVENPPNFSQPDKKQPLKIPFYIWFPLVLFLIFIFSTIFTPHKSDIPDYMTTTNTYTPITPQEPVKTENNPYTCGTITTEGSWSQAMVCTFTMIFSSWFGVLLFFPFVVIVFGCIIGIWRQMR